MSKYCIGNYIHDMRKEKGYTQEDLAFGICSSGTLSRIENGKQVPSASTYEALMQRLGESPQLFSVYVSREELEYDKMNRTILSMLVKNQWRELGAILKIYEQNIQQENHRGRQFLLYTRAILRSYQNETSDNVLQELQKALEITIPQYNEKELLSKRTMTYDEFIIWNNIAIQHRRMGEHKRAFLILKKLLKYLERQNVDEEDTARLYPVILHNLAQWHNQENSYEKAVKTCARGVELCIDYGKLYPLPYLLYQQAIGLNGMGNISEAGELFQQAKIILGVMKRGTANLELEIAITL